MNISHTLALQSPRTPRKTYIFLVLALVLAVLPALCPFPVHGGQKAADLVEDGQQIDLNQDKYARLYDELKTEYGFTQPELDAIFHGVTINKKVLELMDRQWEAKPYYEYYPHFITPGNIATGRQKLIEHKEVLDRIETEIGVDREVVVAIWAVETRYGTYQGAYSVLRTLNTLFDAVQGRET